MKNYYQLGIGFWIGSGVFSLINMAMNLKKAPQFQILRYNYLILAAKARAKKSIDE